MKDRFSQKTLLLVDFAEEKTDSFFGILGLLGKQVRCLLDGRLAVGDCETKDVSLVDRLLSRLESVLKGSVGTLLFSQPQRGLARYVVINRLFWAWADQALPLV